MINAFVATPILVEAGDRVPFAGHRAKTRNSCYCNGGWLTHDDGSGQFLIARAGVYMIGVGAQVTSAVAATVATLALTVNGEALAGTEMAETITAADDVAQLALVLLGQILHTDVGVDSGLSQNLGGAGAPNAIDISESDLDALLTGQINTGNTSHLLQHLLNSPCLCLCLGFSQITMTLPLRLMTLHFSHMGFTDGLTFIVIYLLNA